MGEGNTEDLATLSKLDEHVLLDELRIRYEKDKIYTYVGDILVAVNPYRDLGIYTKQVSVKYQNVQTQSSMPPHIYAIAGATYHAMQGLRGTAPRNQCVLISGESGAGKTESTKFLINQLMELCQGNTQLEQQILQVNPLLEAFGNAQTVMNDNSSRFGKFIQLRFYQGKVIGAKISEYLLEKSRLTKQSPGEQNFHVFYYLFTGLSPEQREQYKLGNAAEYRYLNDGASCLTTGASRLQKQYEDLGNAMDMVGFTDQEQECLFMIVAGALTLGNIVIASGDQGQAKLEDYQALNTACDLLGLHVGEMESVITYSRTFMRGEEIRRDYSQMQALDSRDAVAKAVYGRLFSWIVHKINTIMAPRQVPHPEQVQEIGILDIFGFEHFKTNSFEQACINLANEQLQFFFNKHIFSLEQEEYKREGIDWQEIKFIDNQPLLDLYLGRPIGLLALLDEESQFPKATDQSFVEKLNKKFDDHPNYFKSLHSNSSEFTIAHYAGKVTYQAAGWLDKNRDTLPPGVREMLQQSSNPLISLIFKGQISRTGTLSLQNRRSVRKSTRKQIKDDFQSTKARRQTVGAQFKNSLSVLMERMNKSQPVFIRCIKPNKNKSPNEFDVQYVQAQLLYTGMLETTKIRREGYAIRPTFDEFFNNYKLLAPHGNVKADREGVKTILQASGIQGWQIGKSKVFLKYWNVDQLVGKIQLISKKVIHIQRVVRGFLGRLKAARQREIARLEAQTLERLMIDVEQCSLQMAALQDQAIQGDLKIPPNFFHVTPSAPPHVDLLPPPPPPSDTSYFEPIPDPVPEPEPNVFEEPPPNVTAEEEGSDGEILEDKFLPPPNEEIIYGPPGSRAASTRWFVATQRPQVQTNNGQFADWFHGIITRRDAEILLSDPEQPLGAFLIRVSESRFGYTLSFRAENRCRHYMIDQTHGGKYIIIGEPKVHRSLANLVAFHQRVPLSNWPRVLTKPCGQLEGQCDYADLVTWQPHKQTSRSSHGSHIPPLPTRNYTRPRQARISSGSRHISNLPSGAKVRLSAGRRRTGPRQ